MTTILGLLLIFIGAFSSGSFAVPFGGVKGWKWENYWLSTGLFSFIVLPVIVCMLLVNNFGQLISTVPSSDFWAIFIMGAVYGIGSLTFGLSMRYLGLSLGYALSLGLMAAIGTLVPPALDGRFSMLIDTFNGNMVLLGILISLVGITGIAIAGYQKDQFNAIKEKDENSEFDFKKGVIAALLTGVLASAMSLGIEKGNGVSKLAIESGTNPLFSGNTTMLIMLLGTFVTTLVWCTYLMIKNKTLQEFKNYSFAISFKNLAMTGLAGSLWYLQFIFFGAGKSMLGQYTFAAWGILMAFTIVIAMLWGLFKGEWKGIPSKTRMIMFVSLGIIIVGTFIIGLYNN
ncbi:MAG: L-rhamnose/proton symporter RhaT [Paludibacter sp.]